MAYGLTGLGAVAHYERDSTRAAQLLAVSITMFQELGDHQLRAWPVTVLGRVAKEQGDYGQAAIHLGESLRLFRDLVNPDGTCSTLEAWAGLAAAQRRPLRAAWLFGASEAIRSPIAPCDRAEYERDVGAARAQLNEQMFTAAWAEGQAMTLEQAVAYALNETNPE